MSATLRQATQEDGNEIADMYIASRTINFPYAPMAHSTVDVRKWIIEVLIPSGEVTLAEEAGKIVGMVGLSRVDGVGWIKHFFVLPGLEGQGIGRQLLEFVKLSLGAPIRLTTFQQNTGARRFYERHGFVPILFGDGSDNEEKCPDILYESDTVP